MYIHGVEVDHLRIQLKLHEAHPAVSACAAQSGVALIVGEQLIDGITTGVQLETVVLSLGNATDRSVYSLDGGCGGPGMPEKNHENLGVGIHKQSEDILPAMPASGRIDQIAGPNIRSGLN